MSSSTFALQHQYAEKDAPKRQGLSPIDFTLAVANGRRRYACIAKLMAEATDANQQDLDLNGGSTAPAGGEPTGRRVPVGQRS